MSANVQLPPVRARHTTHVPASVPTAQRKLNQTARDERNIEMAAAVADWGAYTIKRAEDLARKFNKKPRYFLDLFFQGGIHLVKKQAKTNTHNAFQSVKANELRDSTLFNFFFH